MAAVVVDNKVIYFGGNQATYVLEGEGGTEILRFTAKHEPFSFASGVEGGSYRAYKGKLYVWPGNKHLNQLYCLSLDTG